MKPPASEAEDEPEAISAPLPKVTNEFHDYRPPFDVAAVVERMLASVPPKYLVGLSEVVLTNTAGLPRKVRRSVTKSRKRKVRIVEARGLYHQAWNGRPAWIELYVDNILRLWERGLWLSSRLYREQILGDVLFHELGHHIHYTVKPEHQEKEDVADVWMVKLQRNYSKNRFIILGTFIRLVNFMFRPLLAHLAKKIYERSVQKGWMSRAEFEERTKKKDSAKENALFG